MPFVVCRCEEYVWYKRFDEKEIIMNSWIMDAYSEVYSTAMLQDVKPQAFVAVAKKSKEPRFSKLVRALGRA
jgi:hypothetical protein